MADESMDECLGSNFVTEAILRSHMHVILMSNIVSQMESFYRKHFQILRFDSDSYM